MTPLLQVTSRAHTIPLDVITTKTDMTQIVDSAEVEGQPDDGAYVHGWFLQGARWDVPSGTMKESILKVGRPFIHASAQSAFTALRAWLLVWGRLKTDLLCRSSSRRCPSSI